MALQHKRGTAASLASKNPILADGQRCIETDTGMSKAGNGSTAWNALKYERGPTIKKTAAPAATDYLYSVGQEWINTGVTPNKLYKLQDVTGTTASWKQIITSDDISSLGAGDMVKSVYDTNNNGKVDGAEKADQLTTARNIALSGDVTGAAAFSGAADATITTALKAGIALTGAPTAPTAADGTNTTQIATTAFVIAQIAALINSSPAALDTLKELADALGNDPNFAATMTNQLGLKAPLASPALTGTPTAPTAATPDINTTQISTTAFVQLVMQAWPMKPFCRVATTANITLSNTQTIDGVALAVGNRVLVKDQTTASANGIYTVATGAWTRAVDADTAVKLANGLLTFIQEGTLNAGSGWMLTTSGAITLGTTALTFRSISDDGVVS